jgi:hypothetical protein
MNIRQLTTRTGKDWQRAATSCVNGHQFDQANTFRTETGARRCRACDRERKAVRAKELREEAA